MVDTTKSLLEKPASHIPDPPVSRTSSINVGNTERIISAAGGGLLTSYGIRKGTVPGALMAMAGTVLLFRGVTGYCPLNAVIHRDTASGKAPLIKASRTMTINKPVDEIYSFWRNLENLPRFMKHVEHIKTLDEKRAHWQASFPKFRTKLSWDAEIVEDVQGERITWRSVPGASVDNAGEVYFRKAPGQKGTEVQVTLAYRPPAGDLGGQVAKLFNAAFEQMIREDLRRFKHFMETGELPTIQGQPSARKSSDFV